MNWSKRDCGIYVPKYEYAGSNQHGDRYKRVQSKSIPSAILSIEVCSANVIDLKELILLGHHLGIPATYEFTEPQQRISIELVSAVLLREAMKSC